MMKNSNATTEDLISNNDVCVAAQYRCITVAIIILKEIQIIYNNNNNIHNELQSKVNSSIAWKLIKRFNFFLEI